mgnify:CR=1 FL=1
MAVDVPQIGGGAAAAEQADRYVAGSGIVAGVLEGVVAEIGSVAQSTSWRDPVKRFEVVVQIVEKVKDLGAGVTVGDVARITFKEPRLDYGRHLDGKFAVGVSVSKEASANTVAISDEIHRRVAAMNDDGSP